MVDSDSSLQMSVQDFLALRDFVYSKSGIYFRESKKYFLESRINKRMIELSLKSHR